jgi:putative ABC transport system substrate-binding protein
MKRRQCITLVGGVAAWPLAARAQQADRVRQIRFLWAFDQNDPVRRSLGVAFMQGLARSGLDGGPQFARHRLVRFCWWSMTAVIRGETR